MIRLVASLFIVNDSNELLLVKETKVDKYGLPGGKVENGESMREASLRECLEETGLTATIDHLLYVSEKPLTHEGNTVVRYIYKATVDTDTAVEGELSYAYFSRSNLTQLSNDHRIRGADVSALIDDYYSGKTTALPEPVTFRS